MHACAPTSTRSPIRTPARCGKNSALAVASIVVRETHPADDGVRPDDAIAADLAIGVDDRARGDARARADDDIGADAGRWRDARAGVDARRGIDAGSRIDAGAADPGNSCRTTSMNAARTSSTTRASARHAAMPSALARHDARPPRPSAPGDRRHSRRRKTPARSGAVDASDPMCCTWPLRVAEHAARWQSPAHQRARGRRLRQRTCEGGHALRVTRRLRQRCCAGRARRIAATRPRSGPRPRACSARDRRRRT